MRRLKKGILLLFQQARDLKGEVARLLPRLLRSTLVYFLTILSCVNLLIVFMYASFGQERLIEEMLISSSVTTIVGLPGIVFVLFQIARIDELAVKLKKLSVTDPMTGLVNRRELFAMIETHLIDTDEVTRAKLGFLYVDIDHFKAINDQYGHKAGDLAIKAFGNLLQSICSDDMLCARLGGEEFGVLIPNTTPEKAKVLAEAIILSARNLEIQYRDQILGFTVSVGVAVSGQIKTADDLLSQADGALMDAKRMGRNRALSAA